MGAEPLFLVSSGLTLVFGMMYVLNFAHAAFYGKDGGLISELDLMSFLGADGLMQLLSLTTSFREKHGQGRGREGVETENRGGEK